MRAMLTTLASDAWLHDLDPVLLPISGSIAVRWYGLAYIGGFLIAWALTKALAKRGLVRIRPETVGDFILASVFGVVAGGRLGYALFYQPHLFTDFSSSLPFWGLLDLTKGGMASHGGMIGLILASIWVARREKTAPLHVLDTLALVAPPGIFLGRLANFVNGELLGKVVAPPAFMTNGVQDAPWWSVRFPQELRERATSEQVEEIVRLLPQASTEEGYLSLVDQMVRGVRDGDQRAIDFVTPLLNARHPSQLYQAVVEGLIVFVVLWAIWRTPRRPGVITGWFLMVYGVGRIATELIRLPDVGVGRTLGLSRGQWLSTLMVLSGAVLLMFIRQRARQGTWPAPMGGWARAKNGAPEEGAASKTDD